MQSHANAHDTLAHLYLAIGNTDLAKVHAQECGRCAELAGIPRITHLHEALVGLINVKSRLVEEGLAAIHRGLISPSGQMRLMWPITSACALMVTKLPVNRTRRCCFFRSS